MGALRPVGGGRKRKTTEGGGLRRAAPRPCHRRIASTAVRGQPPAPPARSGPCRRGRTDGRHTTHRGNTTGCAEPATAAAQRLPRPAASGLSADSSASPPGGGGRRSASPGAAKGGEGGGRRLWRASNLPSATETGAPPEGRGWLSRAPAAPGGGRRGRWWAEGGRGRAGPGGRGALPLADLDARLRTRRAQTRTGSRRGDAPAGCETCGGRFVVAEGG